MILARQPGAHIASVASSFPSNVVDAAGTVRTLQGLFPEQDPAFIQSLVDRSGVDTRHIVPTVAEVLDPSTFTSRNDRYRSAATELGVIACRRALEKASIGPREIDVVIDVSCTGIMIPALDVRLVPALGLRRDVRRVPITESGCAAGALALGMAGSFAERGLRVLVVAVELCSLSFVHGDRSRTNLVAAVLFGDGAAAAVIRPGGPGPRIEAVGSHLIEGTEGTMGFAIGGHGLQIVLRRELPAVLAARLPQAQASFLREHDRDIDDVGMHLIHPGGRRILEAYKDCNALDGQALRFSAESLRRYGNLSSASILTVLEFALDARVPVTDGKDAFLMAIGPGLSLEMMLLDWEDAR
jgi:alkylresorcinol/alkylpyrone synthase